MNDGRLEGSLLPSLSYGLDLQRTIPLRAPGTFQADPAASWQAGQLLTRNAAGLVVRASGSQCIGVAKWNKADALKAIELGEAVTLVSTTPSNLKHASVSDVKVTSLDGLVTYTGADYVVNGTNGTVARSGASAIPDGDTVLVSYRYDVLAQALDFEGRNFFNFLDDVTIAQGRIAVLLDPCSLFTAQFDTSKNYAMHDVLRCDANGNFTNAGGGQIVGKVIQVPTADDPFLGVELKLV